MAMVTIESAINGVAHGDEHRGFLPVWWSRVNSNCRVPIT
jgi:hypothetical protein